ncbi:GIY-YIG nuclease family protein [Rathayibacter sp. VKM Ac-2759]|uniref:GIY-YIG nuclease family protein n=1 Tax=Rathayibacter sp. VKM Ac-2759 TaxID=2609252 RepID=UPI001FC94F41|nr:GIY-YIG nuclease family protein [Rathayibacter sp. VKM Ac-2759]
MPFVYILRCSDGSYYVGSTRSLHRRVDAHMMGKGAAYTSRRLPVTALAPGVREHRRSVLVGEAHPELEPRQTRSPHARRLRRPPPRLEEDLPAAEGHLPCLLIE